MYAPLFRWEEFLFLFANHLLNLSKLPLLASFIQANFPTLHVPPKSTHFEFLMYSIHGLIYYDFPRHAHFHLPVASWESQAFMLALHFPLPSHLSLSLALRFTSRWSHLQDTFLHRSSYRNFKTTTRQSCGCGSDYGV